MMMMMLLLVVVVVVMVVDVAALNMYVSHVEQVHARRLRQYRPSGSCPLRLREICQLNLPHQFDILPSKPIHRKVFTIDTAPYDVACGASLCGAVVRKPAAPGVLQPLLTRGEGRGESGHGEVAFAGDCVLTLRRGAAMQAAGVSTPPPSCTQVTCHAS
jgi:hypothetical protein